MSSLSSGLSRLACERSVRSLGGTILRTRRRRTVGIGGGVAGVGICTSIGMAAGCVCGGFGCERGGGGESGGDVLGIANIGVDGGWLRAIGERERDR